MPFRSLLLIVVNPRNYLFLFRRVLKSKTVLTACSLSTCLKMLICQCPSATLKTCIRAERAQHRCQVLPRRPPKMTLRNYYSWTFSGQKKNVITHNERDRWDELSNFDIKTNSKTLIFCPCQNYVSNFMNLIFPKVPNARWIPQDFFFLITR